MMTWLHWIGRGYYATPAAFRREALQYGVTRRVSLAQARQMAWGDPVWCVMLQGASGLRFGAFRVERLAGLSAEAVERLMAIGALGACQDLGGRMVARGCGQYQEGGTWGTQWPLDRLVARLAEWAAEGLDIGRLMVGGPWTDLPGVRFADIPQRQGFRAIDAAAVDAAVAAWPHPDRLPLVHGQFYVREPGGAPAADEGAVTLVIDYQRARARRLAARAQGGTKR